MSRCKFDEGWGGICKIEFDGNDQFCSKHNNLTCPCGAKASKLCDHTGIQFVCGTPICEACIHGPVPKDSLFALGGGHINKTDLRICPRCHWYMNLSKKDSEEIVCTECGNKFNKNNCESLGDN